MEPYSESTKANHIDHRDGVKYQFPARPCEGFADLSTLTHAEKIIISIQDFCALCAVLVTISDQHRWTQIEPRFKIMGGKLPHFRV